MYAIGKFTNPIKCSYCYVIYRHITTFHLLWNNICANNDKNSKWMRLSKYACHDQKQTNKSQIGNLNFNSIKMISQFI